MCLANTIQTLVSNGLGAYLYSTCNMYSDILFNVCLLQFGINKVRNFKKLL